MIKSLVAINYGVTVFFKLGHSCGCEYLMWAQARTRDKAKAHETPMGHSGIFFFPSVVTEL